MYLLTGEAGEAPSHFNAGQQTQTKLLIFINQLYLLGTYRLNSIVMIRPHQRIFLKFLPLERLGLAIRIRIY